MVAGLKNARIAVTGACGTVGCALIRRLLESGAYQPGTILGLDNDENELFFSDQTYLHDDRVTFQFADVRDRETLASLFHDIDIVFHAAALKHVVISERTPYEAVRTNVEGVQNVVRAAQQAAVARVIFTSSDKAVNPTSVMGTSKLMGERLITAANASPLTTTRFASTRFGNVLGSTGSVVPIFRRQIQSGGPVTITDARMTRFIMSIEQAADLVLRSVGLVCGGEVFVTKMPVLRIPDLAAVIIDELAPAFGYDPADIVIDLVGMKPGEKLYEELMSDEEMRRAVELDNYFVILPAFRGIYSDIDYVYEGESPQPVDSAYVSNAQPVITRDEIRRLLTDWQLLDTGDDLKGKVPARYWPGDKEESS